MARPGASTVLFWQLLPPGSAGLQPGSGSHAGAWRSQDTPQLSAVKALVTAEELPLFNTLRDWRAERSKRDGVAPYVVCTNRQFAAMVHTRPQSLSGLAEIEGFGKAKLDKYGQENLGLLRQSPAPDTLSAAPEMNHG